MRFSSDSGTTILCHRSLCCHHARCTKYWCFLGGLSQVTHLPPAPLWHHQSLSGQIITFCIKLTHHALHTIADKLGIICVSSLHISSAIKNVTNSHWMMSAISDWIQQCLLIECFPITWNWYDKQFCLVQEVTCMSLPHSYIARIKDPPMVVYLEDIV